MKREPRVVVAAAVITDADGRILIARRPDHVHQGGCWEFPGGKVEPGEPVRAALARELVEELGIVPVAVHPLIRIPFRYPDKSVLLDVWRVTAFEGVPHGREGQPLRWVAPRELADFRFPPANRPIVTAARLPDCYAISADCSDPAACLAALDRTLAAGMRLIQLRVRSLAAEPLRGLAEAAVQRVRAAGGRLLVNGDWRLAGAIDANGVHLTAAQLMGLKQRPLPKGRLVAASCHSPDELARAVALGADFAVLSPVHATVSHPDAAPLGWTHFADWVRDVPLPVYALGGVKPDDLPQARECRAQGVAGIRAFWRSVQ